MKEKEEEALLDSARAPVSTAATQFAEEEMCRSMATPT